MNNLSKNNKISVGNISVSIVKTRRKNSMALTINHGEVRVLVPQRIKRSLIEAFVTDKTKWIHDNLEHQTTKLPIKLHEFVEGESFLFLGKRRQLTLITGVRKNIVLDEAFITVSASKSLSSTSIKNRLKKWYQTQAQIYLAKRTKYFAALMGVNPRLVNTRTYKARWGCCSLNKEITYNWQIIMAPEYIIDYVIVHELCHIKAHNHSAVFWAHVVNVMPDYKERKKWLDKNGHTIVF